MFTPTHHPYRDLTVDSSVVNPGSIATFKVTNISSSSNAVTLLNWTWVPDAGEAEDLTGCPLGPVHKYASPTCAVPIYTSGTMYTRTKQAGGTIEQQDARVDVRTLTVRADKPMAEIGETVTFTAYFGDTPAVISRWRWSGDSQDDLACAGTSSCARVMTQVGRFTMTGYVDGPNGVLQTAEAANITLEPLCPDTNPLTSHPAVQAGFRRILEESDIFNPSATHRRERIMLIYQSGSSVLVLYPVQRSTPCTVSWDWPTTPPGYVYQGSAHVHPFKDDELLPVRDWRECRLDDDDFTPLEYGRDSTTEKASGSDWQRAYEGPGLHYILDRARLIVIDSRGNDPFLKIDPVPNAPPGTPPLVTPLRKSETYKEMPRGSC